MSHIQFSIVANEYQQEEVILLLNEFNPTGFEQKENELLCYFEQESFQEGDIHKILEGFRYTKNIIQEKNWNEEWERNFQPIVIQDFCAIRAHFHAPIPGVEHEIIITPKMSFGTGHHATTYMMIEQMREINFSNKTVFDFGTGTGILAILAQKRGAASVVAIDIDDWSIENAAENISMNNCENINIELSSQIPEQQFDIILANINKNILLQYATSLVNALKSGGTLILSGLLVADEEDILAVYKNEKLNLVNHKQKNGWISLGFVNGNR